MGRTSKAFGNLFEHVFFRTCRSHGVAVTRIPDGCRQVGNKLIRVKTPCDWVLTYKNRTALIDTKTAQGDVFNVSKITEHQVNELYSHEKLGAIAGYVIWLRETNRVFFIPAVALLSSLSSKGSISDAHPFATYLGDEKFDIKLIFGGPALS